MKEIEGWSGYCITEEGDAISFKGKTPKVLNQISNKYGYLVVNLYRGGEMRQKRVNRLVAEAFIPNPLGLPDVNHKNEDKTDNRVENLEWCTHKDNCNHGTRNERVSEALRGRKHTDEARNKMINHPKKSKPVSAYRDGEWVGDYPSANEAARQLGLSQSNISSCCRGEYKQTGGYVFVYKDGE